MASVHGGLFQASPPASTQVTHAPSPQAGHLGLASVTAGFDTSSGGTTGPGLRISGTLQGSGTENVVASQTTEGGNVVLHLPDGSTITVVGVTHISASFIH
jgi:hypothetical protein